MSIHPPGVFHNSYADSRSLPIVEDHKMAIRLSNLDFVLGGVTLVIAIAYRPRRLRPHAGVAGHGPVAGGAGAEWLALTASVRRCGWARNFRVAHGTARGRGHGGNHTIVWGVENP